MASRMIWFVEIAALAPRLAIAGLVVCLSWLTGESVGRQNSPPYAYEEEGAVYLLANARLARPSATTAIVRLNAGPDVYIYSWPQGRLVRRAATRHESRANRWLIWEMYRLNRLSGESPFAAIADVKSRVTGLRRIAGANSRGQGPLGPLTIIVATTFGIVGYLGTYRDVRNYRNAEFVRGMTRISLFQLIAARSVECSEIRTTLHELQRPADTKPDEPSVRDAYHRLREASKPEIIAALRSEAKDCEAWSRFFQET